MTGSLLLDILLGCFSFHYMNKLFFNKIFAEQVGKKDKAVT